MGYMDIEEYNGYLYAIQNSSQYIGGRLCVLDKNLNLVSSFENIGNCRQIKIYDGIAAISARSNGLWIFDVTKEQPILLSHYQTIELATGITMCKDYVFVSCRQYGVEIVDIKNPEKPIHKGIIRLGEVQSSWIDGDRLYCGLWGEMKVVCYNLMKESVEFEFNLHGRGDGVLVKDGLLYAVSGQHGRNIKNLSDQNDPEYGNGNGISIFDLSENKEIFYDSFGKGYSISYDMWKPILCGDKLVCCDSIMGVHVYDSKTFKKLLSYKMPEINEKTDAVTGAVSLNGALYISCAMGGIYKIDSLFFDLTFKNSHSNKINFNKKQIEYVARGTGDIKMLYNGDFPVLNIADHRKYFILACGIDGIHVIDKTNFKCAYKVKTNGFCCDVKVFDDNVYAACSGDGVCAYKINDSGLSFKFSFRKNKDIQQLKLSKNGKYLACCLESTEVIMLEILSDGFVELYSRVAKQGPLYGENFTSSYLEDGTMLMFWHRDGLIYSNPESGDREFNEIFYKKKNGFMSFGPENGCDTDGKNIFFNLDGGYVILPKKENVEVDELLCYKTEIPICGKIVVKNNKLIAIERSKGIITVQDISDIYNPKHIEKITISSSCSKAVIIDERIFIPAWHDGLLELVI